MREGMLGIICRFRYFRVGPFILEGVVGKIRKVWFGKLLYKKRCKKQVKAKLFCRKKKVKKVANSRELCISFPIAARPCTVVGRCGMIPVLKSQEPSESLCFATRIEFQSVPVRIGLLSVPSIPSSKCPVFRPAKMQEPFRSHIGQVLCEHLDRFVLVPTAQFRLGH